MLVAPTLLKLTPEAGLEGAVQPVLPNLKKPRLDIEFELLTAGELKVPPIEL
jgi:hypothetical protein